MSSLLLGTSQSGTNLDDTVKPDSRAITNADTAFSDAPSPMAYEQYSAKDSYRDLLIKPVDGLSRVAVARTKLSLFSMKRRFPQQTKSDAKG
jgi:hypothetical protein